ncbi:SAM-dependent methyltransferase [Nonlabens tegetincola]|uniref:SAM-dependent methyltransferase n=1 Tax=Nonlabens tegetincola TaxID=323273 RepID=UPI000CF5442D|nr:class I SAM-dependent methyltransferase [Nonlabens tegetincola]PQJ19370.1 SAM-dependent methyltransferase [Nonlabens tegetincola]
MRAQKQEWYASWFNTPYYHILYGDRDYEEAGAFMNNLTTALSLQADSHIMDLACGRGRHSLFLNKLGFKVTGVDLSENSIDFARKQLEQDASVDSSRITFDVHNMTLPYHDKFDAVFNLFTSFGYFDEEQDNLNTIKSIKKNLKDGAYAVIDFMNVPHVLRHLIISNSKTIQGITFNMNRRFENGFIYKDIEFTDGGNKYHFTERVSALMLSDFQKYFDQAGLELIDIYGDYQLNEYDKFNSSRLIMILRKQ